MEDGLQRTRQRLAASRARGEPWEAAWPAALAALDAAAKRDRRGQAAAEAAALRACEESWRAAFERWPPPAGEYAVPRPSEGEPDQWPPQVAAPRGMSR